MLLMICSTPLNESVSEGSEVTASSQENSGVVRIFYKAALIFVGIKFSSPFTPNITIQTKFCLC